jgi:abortive infection bacteriophage resistance protein
MVIFKTFPLQTFGVISGFYMFLKLKKKKKKKKKSLFQGNSKTYKVHTFSIGVIRWFCVFGRVIKVYPLLVLHLKVFAKVS